MSGVCFADSMKNHVLNLETCFFLLFYLDRILLSRENAHKNDESWQSTYDDLVSRFTHLQPIYFPSIDDRAIS